LHFHSSLARCSSYIQSCHDDQWTASTRAAELPVTIATTNGHIWEYDLPACKEQINQ
jgi:hypothetical protein